MVGFIYFEEALDEFVDRLSLQEKGKNIGWLQDFSLEWEVTIS